jgi:hypothetical protein
VISEHPTRVAKQVEQSTMLRRHNLKAADRD